MSADERPRFIYAYAEMAQVAEDIRRNRAEGDPALVDAGKLSADDAATRLRISTAIADLKGVLVGAEKRRDHARTAMMHEYGAAIGDLSRGELWAIHDSHDTRSLRILPYLRWESYAAAIEAMLWWQERPHFEGRRFITMVNQQLRGMGYVAPEQQAA